MMRFQVSIGRRADLARPARPARRSGRYVVALSYAPGDRTLRVTVGGQSVDAHERIAARTLPTGSVTTPPPVTSPA
jgi:hypothetical protein